MSKSTTFHIESGSPEAATIRAAYEILLGCLSLTEVSKELMSLRCRKSPNA